MATQIKPTWLYIKQHNVTGLKYFGKTINDPIVYKGSGKRWVNHIKKHGNDVTTIWCQLFKDKETMVLYATSFSKEHNITESTEWANLMIEDGLQGGFTGPISVETKIKRSIAQKKRVRMPVSNDTKIKISNSKKGQEPWNKGKTGIYSAEAIAHLSAINTGKKQSAETIIKKTASQTGTTRSNEAKQNMSNAQVGRIISVAARKKLSLCNTGKTMSAETKAKISATAKLKREERKTK